MTWCLTHQQDAKACKFCHFVPTPLRTPPAALVDRTGWFTPIHWER
jgi:hypothetical protein